MIIYSKNYLFFFMIFKAVMYACKLLEIVCSELSLEISLYFFLSLAYLLIIVNIFYIKFI